VWRKGSRGRGEGQHNKEKLEQWSTEERIIRQKNKKKIRNTEEVQHRWGDKRVRETMYD